MLQTLHEGYHKSLLSFLHKKKTQPFLSAVFNLLLLPQLLHLHKVSSPERVRRRHGDPLRKDEAICISNHKEMTTDSPK